ncbi:hypothetical protein [Thiolapillus sp.]|uniref:hypothetical protein n=1 Tax=Thiolapillus sp. TaxID=2017437 RepID=UPI003AF672C5
MFWRQLAKKFTGFSSFAFTSGGIDGVFRDFQPGCEDIGKTVEDFVSHIIAVAVVFLFFSAASRGKSDQQA